MVTDPHAGSPVYVFAYGSLIWRPGFCFDRVFKARVSGYERRFWQASHDHRGTPEAPGRVVTLVPMAGSYCEGLVYALPPIETAGILSNLDYREKDGYERVIVQLDASTSGIDTALTWIAKPGNPSWRGEQANPELAQLIATRSGPSGSNADYLFSLFEALQRHGIADSHVESLFALVREINS